MRVLCLHDKPTIAAALLRNPHLHLYEIGDLDDFFWSFTTWYGLERDGRIEAVALLYSGAALPVLLALDEPPAEAARELVRRVRHFLPRRLYAHLSEGVLEGLGDAYRVQPRGTHLKMALTYPAQLDGIDTAGIERLGPGDLAELQAFYARSYPGNWFDPRMLETGQFVGLRGGGELLCVAGIHVHSPAYRVTALGNIATRPDARGRGLSRRTTAALCRSLVDAGFRVGLNVDAENAPAIACYRRLGFTDVAAYHEIDLSESADEAQARS